jgi:putative zinc finger/helix-turn-helix YgiT family protein
MKKECPICGAKALVEKIGEFRFEPPANIPGGVIILPNSNWEECDACGEVLLSPELLRKLDEQRYARLGRLTPTEIKAIRENAGLTQSKIAKKLKIGEKTYTRWESGRSLQNKSNDNLIRLFAENPNSFEDLETQRGSTQNDRLASYFLNFSQHSLWSEEKSTKTSEVVPTTENKNYRPAA